MKKNLLTLLAAALSTSVMAGEMQSLRGQALEQSSAKPPRMKLMVVDGGIERSYKEQPPMVPHEVDKYEINLKTNGCLKCHSEKTYEKEKSPKVGDSHYLDRNGNKTEGLSTNRYFCNQCHAPQLSGTPLVKNLFHGRQ